MTTATTVRASDTERQAVVDRLHHALGEGRLDLSETDERVAAAYASVTRAELGPLLADLPDATPAATGLPTWAAVWAMLVWRVRATLLGDDEPAPTSAQRRNAALLIAVTVAFAAVCALLGAVVAH